LAPLYWHTVGRWQEARPFYVDYLSRRVYLDLTRGFMQTGSAE